MVDRPTLVDRGDDEDNTEEQATDEDVVDVLGDGDGPVINSIRFEKGDYGVVATSNLVAILSTAQTEGPEYEQAFMTAAIQVKEMTKSGIDISPIARLSRDRGVDDVNVTQSQLQDLKLATSTLGEEDDELDGEEAREIVEEAVEEVEGIEGGDDDDDESVEDSEEDLEGGDGDEGEEDLEGISEAEEEAQDDGE